MLTIFGRRSRLLHFALTLSGILPAACAHEPAPQRSAASGAAEERGIIDEVAAVRGLAPKAPVESRSISAQEMSALVSQKVAETRTPESTKKMHAAWLAFGLVPPGFAVEQTLGAVLDEQVAGLYDPKQRSLYVRPVPPGTATTASTALSRVILAHEIEHALQDQHFGLPTPEALLAMPSDDARLAIQALYEGDATAVMVALVARKTGKDISETLDAAHEQMRKLPARALLAFIGKGSALEHAPGVIREQLLFPYFEGLAFIADIHRTGGFDLVNRTFQHAPTTTEHILHPEKYLAGEAAIPVRSPRAPTGHQVVLEGVLGELGARTLLGDCIGPLEAGKAAAGWGGDAFLVTEGEAGALAVLWSTVWDDEDAATKFATALARLPSCWPKEEAFSAEASGWKVAPTVRVMRRGRRVAFVRGLAENQLDAATQALLDLPGRPPVARPPLGALTIPPPRSARAALGKARVVGDRVIHDGLGLEATVPEGFTPQLDRAGILIGMHRPPQTTIAVTYVPPDGTRYEGEPLREIFSNAVVALGATMSKSSAPLERGTVSQLTTPLGPALEEVISLGERGNVRIMLLPVCDARAALLLFSAVPASDTHAAVQRVVDSLRWSRPEAPPPICPR